MAGPRDGEQILQLLFMEEKCLLAGRPARGGGRLGRPRAVSRAGRAGGRARVPSPVPGPSAPGSWTQEPSGLVSLSGKPPGFHPGLRVYALPNPTLTLLSCWIPSRTLAAQARGLVLKAAPQAQLSVVTTTPPRSL